MISARCPPLSERTSAARSLGSEPAALSPPAGRRTTSAGGASAAACPHADLARPASNHRRETEGPAAVKNASRPRAQRHFHLRRKPRLHRITEYSPPNAPDFTLAQSPSAGARPFPIRPFRLRLQQPRQGSPEVRLRNSNYSVVGLC